MKGNRIKIFRMVVSLVICVLCLTGCHKNDDTDKLTLTPTLAPDQDISQAPEPATTDITVSEQNPADLPKADDQPTDEALTDGNGLEEPVIKTAVVSYADYGRILE